MRVSTETGRLVEDQDRRVADDRARERDELALSGRQRRAALADLRVEALGQRLDEVERARDLAAARELPRRWRRASP